jgi:hypothetical protein
MPGEEDPLKKTYIFKPLENGQFQLAAHTGDGGELTGQPEKLARDQAQHHAGGGLPFRGGRHLGAGRTRAGKREGVAECLRK